VIDRLLAPARRFEDDREVVLQRALSDELFQLARTEPRLESVLPRSDR